MLDDVRDAVRNAALLLLVDLTSGANEELRKIVAFEEVFAKIFALIRMEGGLAEAGITAQDCLSLLANLITGSGSNQTMFRESGCVSQLAELLAQVFPASISEPAYTTQSREKSAFGLLQVLRFFFAAGEPSTPQNQVAFFRTGIAQTLIDIGFSSDLPVRIRMASLRCAAELIANNPTLQENFAGLTVASADESESSASPAPQVNGTRSAGPSERGGKKPSAERQRTYIIEALLELTLSSPQPGFGLRSTACALVQAYLAGHDRIKAHFLHRAISGHAQNESAANALNALTSVGDDAVSALFASWIVQDLTLDDFNAKAALESVKEGNKSEGEDVLSFIQTLGSELESALLHSTDDVAVAAYASLLTTYLWNFASGIDNFLTECSSLVQALTQLAKAAQSSAIRRGLAAALLGTIYEFSTKDSPIPRRQIAPLLTQNLSRSKYLDALAALRSTPAIRDFELREADEEDVVFCESFVNLFTVEYSRLRKAIDKDPGMEVLPPSAAEAGVDRDVLDDLRQQLQTGKDALTQAQDAGRAATQKHEQERMALGKELQSVRAEVERLQRINQSMQQGHESELEKLNANHQRQQQELLTKHQRSLDAATQATTVQVQNSIRERDASYAEKIQEYERRLVELGNTYRAEQSGHNNTRQQLERMTANHDAVAAREQSLKDQFADLNQRHSRLSREHEQLGNSSSQSTGELERIKGELEQVRSRAERLDAQLKDLQEELKSRDQELAVERAGFSELERELEAAKKGASSSTLPNDSGEKVAELQQELREARESEKSAKEELDSMLLVMGDIEAKRDAYREQVKALGGAVSEDDADEEEEDDEEEEGEDVD